MNFPILRRPRYLFDLENLFDSTLEAFDPFDVLDQELCRHVLWVRKPILIEKRKRALVPFKYRFIFDLHANTTDLIETEIVRSILNVKRVSELKNEEVDSKIEYQKSIHLPKNLDEKKMIALLTPKGQLVIEIPFKSGVLKQEEFEIKENADGSGRINFQMNIKDLNFNNLKAIAKDLDLLVTIEVPQEIAEVKAYKILKLHLPDNTDLSSLNCVYNNDALMIDGKLYQESKSVQKVPITDSLLHIPQEHMTRIKVILKPKTKHFITPHVTAGKLDTDAIELVAPAESSLSSSNSFEMLPEIVELPSVVDLLPSLANLKKK